MLVLLCFEMRFIIDRQKHRKHNYDNNHSRCFQTRQAGKASSRFHFSCHDRDFCYKTELNLLK